MSAEWAVPILLGTCKSQADPVLQKVAMVEGQAQHHSKQKNLSPLVSPLSRLSLSLCLSLCLCLCLCLCISVGYRYGINTVSAFAFGALGVPSFMNRFGCLLDAGDLRQIAEDAHNATKVFFIHGRVVLKPSFDDDNTFCFVMGD